jgi:hypothetical protein
VGYEPQLYHTYYAEICEGQQGHLCESSQLGFARCQDQQRSWTEGFEKIKEYGEVYQAGRKQSVYIEPAFLSNAG